MRAIKGNNKPIRIIRIIIICQDPIIPSICILIKFVFAININSELVENSSITL